MRELWTNAAARVCGPDRERGRASARQRSSSARASRWLCAIGLLVVVALADAGPAHADTHAPKDPLGSSQWRYMVRKFFRNDRVVFDDRVKIKAPIHASTALATPVQVSAPQLTGVEHVLVFADQDPAPRILDYQPLRARPALGFSVTIRQATALRAAMRTADGVWHVGGVWVDAQGGGCSLPNLTASRNDTNAQTGATTARIWPRGETGERLKVRVTHPMDAGQAADRPTFYIDSLQIEDPRGNLLARVLPRATLARNPVFTLDLDYRGALEIKAGDNRDGRFSAQAAAPSS